MEEMHPEWGKEYVVENVGDKDLFEDVRDELQLMYISDIPMVKNPSVLVQAVERINPEHYSQRQWRNLLLYILKTK